MRPIAVAENTEKARRFRIPISVIRRMLRTGRSGRLMAVANSAKTNGAAHFRRGCLASDNGRFSGELAAHPIITESYQSSDGQQEQQPRWTGCQRQGRLYGHTLHSVAFFHQQDWSG